MFWKIWVKRKQIRLMWRTFELAPLPTWQLVVALIVNTNVEIVGIIDEMVCSSNIRELCSIRHVTGHTSCNNHGSHHMVFTLHSVWAITNNVLWGIAESSEKGIKMLKTIYHCMTKFLIELASRFKATTKLSNIVFSFSFPFVSLIALKMIHWVGI